MNTTCVSGFFEENDSFSPWQELELLSRSQNGIFILYRFCFEGRYYVLKASAGTPLYAAPEQQEGRKGDCRSDIYSLGVILLPFARNKRQRSVAEKCLRKDAGQRYASVGQLHKAFFPQLKNRVLIMLALLVLVLSGVGLILIDRLQEARSIYQDQTIDSIFLQATELLEEAGGLED